MGDELLRILCLGDKDISVVAAMVRHHLGKACVYTADDVVQLRKEKQMLDRGKVAKAKMRQQKAAAKVVSSREESKSSKHVEKIIIDANMVLVIVLSDWEDEEEDIVGGHEWDEEENGGEEEAVVYSGDLLDLDVRGSA